MQIDKDKIVPQIAGLLLILGILAILYQTF